MFTFLNKESKILNIKVDKAYEKKGSSSSWSLLNMLPDELN